MEEPGLLDKRVLVLGCGNVLFGDDGFGPAVVDYFRDHFAAPEDASLIDAGIGVRNILFDVAIGQGGTRKIVIVDAVDAGREPGEIFSLDVSEIPEKKIDDFSMHQIPTSNLLREIKDLRRVEVRVICAQVESIPESVRPGLSETLVRALPLACEKILEEIRRPST